MTNNILRPGLGSANLSANPATHPVFSPGPNPELSQISTLGLVEGSAAYLTNNISIPLDSAEPTALQDSTPRGVTLADLSQHYDFQGIQKFASRPPSRTSKKANIFGALPRLFSGEKNLAQWWGDLSLQIHGSAPIATPELDLNPKLLEKFRGKARFDPKFFENLQAEIDAQDPETSYFSRENFLEVGELVQAVLQRRLDPHAAFLKILLISERDFYLKLETMSGARVRWLTPREAAQAYRELLSAPEALTSQNLQGPEDLARTYQRLGIFSRSDLRVVEILASESKHDFLGNPFVMQNLQQGLLPAQSTLVDREGKYHFGNTLYVSTLETLLELALEKPRAAHIKIDNRLSSDEAAIQNIAEDSWSFAFSTQPIVLTHYDVRRTLDIRSPADAEGSEMKYPLHPYAVFSHDIFHHRILSEHTPPLRQLVAEILRAFRGIAESDPAVLTAYSDLIQTSWIPEMTVAAYLSNSEDILRAIGGFFASAHKFDPGRLADFLLRMTLHPELNPRHYLRAGSLEGFVSMGPIINATAPMLRADSRHLEFALDFLRHPRVRAALNRHYGFRLTDDAPRSLEQLYQSHPLTRYSNSPLYSDTEKASEAFEILQALGLVPEEQSPGDIPVDLNAANQRKRQQEDARQYLADLNQRMNLLPRGYPSDLKDILFSKSENVWEKLGLDEEFRAVFPSLEDFRKSSLSFLEIYRELKARLALEALDSPKFEANPEMIAEFRKRISFGLGFFENLQAEITTQKFGKGSFSRRNILLVQALVQAVLLNQLDPHEAFYKILKISEHDFHLQLEKSYGAKIRTWTPRNAAQAYRELLRGPQHAEKDPSHLERTYRRLGILNLPDVIISEITFPKDFDFSQDLFLEQSFEQGALPAMEQFLDKDAIAVGDTYFFLPIEILFKLVFEKPNSMQAIIYNNLTSDEEAIRHIAEDRWNFAFSIEPIELTHYDARRTLAIRSEDQAREIEFTQRVHPLTAILHDIFHYTLLSDNTRPVRQWMVEASRAFRDIARAPRRILNAYSDFIQTIAAPGLTLRQYLSYNDYVMKAIGGFFASAESFVPERLTEFLLRLFHHPELDPRGYMQTTRHNPLILGPILDVLNPMLRADSPHLEFALAFLRIPEIRSQLNRHYGYRLTNQEPRTLEELYAANYSTQYLKTPIYSESEKASEEFQILQALGLIAGTNFAEGTPVDLEAASRREKDRLDERRKFSHYSLELVADPAYQVPTRALGDPELRDILSSTDSWENLGLATEFQAAFPSVEDFRDSSLSLLEIYQELKGLK